MQGKRADHYLTQSPAVSKGLCVVDLHVAGGRHVVHCHAVKITTESCQKALEEETEKAKFSPLIFFDLFTFRFFRM